MSGQSLQSMDPDIQSAAVCVFNKLKQCLVAVAQPGFEPSPSTLSMKTVSTFPLNAFFVHSQSVSGAAVTQASAAANAADSVLFEEQTRGFDLKAKCRRYIRQIRERPRTDSKK